MIRAPAFWQQPAGVLARVLSPFGLLYGRVTAWRMARPGRRVRVPVICVGNLTIGGTGKTPTVLMLAEALAAAGERPFVVSRGYGGSLPGPIRVDPARHTADACGDEPLLLARHAPTIVSKDRAAGAQFAAGEGATVVLLDDGLQNPSLEKDFRIAVVDAGAGLGNGLCFPAGPLRAPAQAQLPHVDALLLVGAGAVPPVLARAIGPDTTHRARLMPDPAAVAALAGRSLLAFAGIGRPEKFFSTLTDADLSVAECRAFPDHHVYSERELRDLEAVAARRGLSLVTTQKDAVRIGTARVAVLPVTLSTEDDRLVSAVKAAIDRRRSEP